jgi:periplasmic protein TonB
MSVAAMRIKAGQGANGGLRQALRVGIRSISQVARLHGSRNIIGRETKMAAQKQATTLRARVSERFLLPAPKGLAFRRRTWFAVTTAGVLCLYAVALAALLWRDRDMPAEMAQVAETPIEVVVEPPKAAPPPAPAPAAPPEEKPATSAPRAFNDAPTPATATDAETHAPKASLPAAAAPPTAAPPSADKAEPNEAAAADAQAPDVPKDDAEALAKAVPQPPRRPTFKADPVAKATAKDLPGRHSPTALQQLAGASPLPDYAFAKPMRRHAKVTGGTEDDRYLAVVYGLITRDRSIMAPDGDWHVAVAFEVDGSGDLVGVAIQQSSGYPQVDAAAVHAIERAAPFPPPPSGARTGLVARLNSGGAADGE